MLTLGHDATLASLHEVLLGQATGSVLGSAVENLGLAANCDHAAHHYVILAVLASGRVHLLYFTQ